MTTLRRTIEGDVLDEIVWKHYGNVRGALEFVLAQNPALRHEGAVLAQGQIVRLPKFTVLETTPKVRLWS